MRTTAAVLWELGGKWEVEEVELDPPNAGEVLVELAASGLCHSDEHLVTGDLPVGFPMVGGHEGAGRVIEIGPGVTDVAVGDPVVMTFLPSCGRCGGNATQATLDNAVAGLATAKARLEQMQAALHVAEDQIGYTELRATFDGVVTEWSVEVGQYITTGQAAVTIARPDVREAVVDIPDDLIGRVAPDMEFLVRVQAAPAFTTKARVREIGPLADAMTRTHRVRMTLEDPPRAFRIGTMVTASVTRDIAPKIMVPPWAVLEEGGKHSVWVLAKDGASVSRRDVTIAGREDDKLVVASGLTGGERIVTVGVNSLRDGQAVAGEMPSSVTAASAK